MTVPVPDYFRSFPSFFRMIQYDENKVNPSCLDIFQKLLLLSNNGMDKMDAKETFGLLVSSLNCDKYLQKNNEYSKTRNFLLNNIRLNPYSNSYYFDSSIYPIHIVTLKMELQKINLHH